MPRISAIPAFAPAFDRWIAHYSSSGGMMKGRVHDVIAAGAMTSGVHAEPMGTVGVAAQLAWTETGIDIVLPEGGTYYVHAHWRFMTANWDSVWWTLRAGSKIRDDYQIRAPIAMVPGSLSASICGVIGGPQSTIISLMCRGDTMSNNMLFMRHSMSVRRLS